jgi:hypothetical protein
MQKHFIFSCEGASSSDKDALAQFSSWECQFEVLSSAVSVGELLSKGHWAPPAPIRWSQRGIPRRCRKPVLGLLIFRRNIGCFSREAENRGALKELLASAGLDRRPVVSLSFGKWSYSFDGSSNSYASKPSTELPRMPSEPRSGLPSRSTCWSRS